MVGGELGDDGVEQGEVAEFRCSGELWEMMETALRWSRESGEDTGRCGLARGLWW